MGLKKPLIIGHRGSMSTAPENTLASFHQAVKQGCDGIELDIQLTRDGQIVVCHDETIDRTTNGSGEIIRMSVQEIKRYDAGSWFSPVYQGERIPLLDEVLDSIPQHLLLNIEIKSFSPYSAYLGVQLLATLHRKSAWDRTVVSSFDHSLLQRLKWREPRVRIGLLFPFEFLGSYTEHAKTLGVEVYSLHPHYFLLNRRDVQTALASGYNVFPYTVDSVKDMKRLIKSGVSGIITNFPRLLYQTRRQKNRTNGR